jgi:hypothetical protein
MVTRFKQQTVKSFKLEFSDEPVTSYGGYALVERLASKLGLWNAMGGALPERPGCRHDWLCTIKALVAGLLTGARGTFSAEPVREDSALLKLMGLKGAPEEASVWRMLEPLGSDLGETLQGLQRQWTKRILSSTSRRDLFVDGFLPIFGDGTLLEGSRRREGTKWIEDKGHGLLWTTIFAGPLVAAQRFCDPGQGETASLMAMLPGVVDEALGPLKLKEHALVLLDSLHGDGPTLDAIEGLGLRYVVGANKLSRSATVLEAMAEVQWQSCGARPHLGWAASATCTAWIQCEGWERKRLLVGRRWRREGEFLYQYRAVMTNLCEADVAHLTRGAASLAEAVWRLYDRKGAMEVGYKELLEDLGLHHPPCRELARNRGFYAVATLAHTLGRAVDLIGGKRPDRGRKHRRDGRKRKRPEPRSMRLWRLRRTLFALPASITTHARQATVKLLGVGPQSERLFKCYWSAVCRC